MTTKRALIEESLQAIWDERERLTPADVLEVAEESTHPLHPFFEWDDSEAATQFRLAQAAGLIRSVKIKLTTVHGGEVTDLQVRRWLAPKAAGADTQSGYQPEDVVRVQPELREAIVRQMARDVAAMRRRYAHMTEFWDALDSLDRPQEVATG